MKRLLIILLCLTLLLGVTACGQKEENNTTSPTENNGEQGAATYAMDPQINRFFTECIAAYPKAVDPLTIRRASGTANSDSADLHKEYLATIDECNVTVRNISREITPDNGDAPYMVYQLRIIIEGGLTEQSRDKMMSAFSKICQAIDPSCSKDIAAEAVAHLESQTNTLADYRFSSGLKVERYMPIVKEHGAACRIELLAINYVAA